MRGHPYNNDQNLNKQLNTNHTNPADHPDRLLNARATKSRPHVKPAHHYIKVVAVKLATFSSITRPLATVCHPSLTPIA